MSEDKTVSFRVFLDDSERTLFKVACVEEKTTMSQKTRELISEWLQDRKERKQQ